MAPEKADPADPIFSETGSARVVERRDHQQPESKDEQGYGDRSRPLCEHRGEPEHGEKQG